MVKHSRKITVEQVFNAKFNPGLPISPLNNKCVYWVIKAVNVLEPAVASWLNPSQVRQLIDNDIEVIILPSKD